MTGLVYRVIYLTGANGVASAVLTLGHAASKKECLRRNLGPDRVRPEIKVGRLVGRPAGMADRRSRSPVGGARQSARA